MPIPEYRTTTITIDAERERTAKAWREAFVAGSTVWHAGSSWRITALLTRYNPLRYDFHLTTEPKGFTMSNDPVANKSLAVFLLNTPGLSAVKVTYEGFDPQGKPLGSTLLFKTFEKDLKVGELVIVPTHTRVGYTCVGIAEIDVEPDLESTAQVDWIVGRFDTAAYAAIQQKERQIIDAIKAADKRAKQEELKKRLLGNVDPDSLPVIELTALAAPSSEGDKSGS